MNRRNRKGMKVNDLVKVKIVREDNYHYLQVESFFDLDDGEGVVLIGPYTGWIEARIPIADIEEINFFTDIREMEEDMQA